MRIIEVIDIQKIIDYNATRPTQPVVVWSVGYKVVCDYNVTINYSTISEKEAIKAWPQHWLFDYGKIVSLPAGSEQEQSGWKGEYQKTAVVLKSKELTELPSIWKESDFHIVERDGKEYKKISSFNQYWHVDEDENKGLDYDLINQFDGFFETESEYNAWINSTDIVPTKLVILNISNHPHDKTVTRKAEVSKIPIIDFLKNKVTMETIVKHYRNDVHIPVEIPDIEVQFTADNEIKREHEGQMIGEYDLLVQMHEEGYKIWDLVQGEIMRNDSTGLLNERCNY